ncbi:TetR/AcrR family transcriptional regulator [Clostridium sp. SHJSY1]|uniref:TetR/AcrR family transcriptional regulator n=1 Tax=Clostridium sp. SHJSY1 TaxID=2942483 RepID=UPI0028751F62|nr:TetR/AcrR family transcriptional regulator [Clostridium sp. SHJSY1]MDS0525630.1 TetR/AcrR family transcriptional regulator [Clostridium sp. SHJSY1]
MERNTKERFIETASRLFEAKGYNATGLNEILKECKAPKGSFYYHFPNGKEELALESIRLAGEKITTNLKKTLDMFEEPTPGILLNINNLADIIDDKKKMDNVSISLIALETYDSSEVLREASEKVFLSIEKIYMKKLIEYKLDEEKAKSISLTLSVMTEGAILLSLTRRSGEPLRKIGEQIKVIINQ